MDPKCKMFPRVRRCSMTSRSWIILICCMAVLLLLCLTRYAKFDTSSLPLITGTGRAGRMKDSGKSPYPEIERSYATDPKHTKHSLGIPKLPHANLSIEDRFAQRKRRLDEGCKLYRQASKNPKVAYRGLFISIPDNVFYCPIEKVSSSEWKDLFRDMLTKRVKSYSLFNWSKALSYQINPFRSAKVKFFFVREPYGRLLSGYVDKLFSPNVDYWQIGKRIVERFRPRPSKLSLRCGHDVTFAEFIDYVIESERTGFMSEGHFTPQFKHCHVCDFPYSYVGHLETLQEDRDLLLRKMRSPVSPSPKYEHRSLGWQVSTYFRDYKRYKSCMTMDEALRRLWQKMKIRGHLHSSLTFPLTPQQSQNISVQSFLNIAKTALEASQKIDGSNVKANKRRALQEAFDTVSLTTKRKLAKLFSWDFVLFGYDPYPQEVFGNSFQTEGGEEESSLFSLYNL